MFPIFGKRKEEKNFKEKRKGRRGNYTILITLAIMLLFSLLYFLLPARVIPTRTPTPTLLPPTPTVRKATQTAFIPTNTLPALQPTTNVTSTGSAVVVAPLKPLILEALCAPSQFTSSWQVKNVNAVDVPFTYIIQSFGTSATGKLTAPAMTGSNASVLKFNSYMEEGGVIMRIFVNDELQAVAAGNAEPCPVTPTARLTPSPALTQVSSAGFPDWAYLKPNEFGANVPPDTLSKDELLIQPEFFKPYVGDIKNGDVVETPKILDFNPSVLDVPTGSGTNNWIFKGIEAQINISDSSAPHTGMFFYINNGTGGNAPFRNGDDFKKMVETFNRRGIFFVDGSIDTDELWPNDVTLIATGTIHVRLKGATNVGKGSVYAFGISFLAGREIVGIPPATPSVLCVTDHPPIDWAVHFEGEKNGWSGVAYVPNGLFWIDSDYQLSATPAGPVVALSQVSKAACK